MDNIKEAWGKLLERVYGIIIDLTELTVMEFIDLIKVIASLIEDIFMWILVISIILIAIPVILVALVFVGIFGIASLLCGGFIIKETCGKDDNEKE